MKQKITEEHKKKISLAMLGNKNGIGNTGNKINAIDNLKYWVGRSGKENPFYGQHHSEETKKYLSEIMQGQTPWNTGKHIAPGTEEDKQKRIDSIRNSHKGKTYEEIHGPEKAAQLRKIRSEKTKQLLKTTPGMGFPIDGTMKIRRSKQIFPMIDTKIEQKIEAFLKLLQIDYQKHVYMNMIRDAYQCDFLIPQLKIVIEADGDYWHGNPKKFTGAKLKEFQIQQREEDARRTEQLTNHGYKVIRLWESEIKTLAIENFKKLIQ